MRLIEILQLTLGLLRLF